MSSLGLSANQFPFTKALGDDVVEMAQRRPNPYACTVDQCKCKKFEGNSSGERQDADGTGMFTIMHGRIMCLGRDLRWCMRKYGPFKKGRMLTLCSYFQYILYR